MKHVLVTGGAGFIGSHVADALLARGDRVRVLDNLLPQAHPTGRPRFVADSAELVVADLRDRPALDAALAEVDTVIHLGGMVGNGQSMHDVRRYVDVNATGTATLLEAIIARRDAIRRLVVASSMVVYGDGAYACPEHGELPGAPSRPIERMHSGLWEPICPTCGAEVRSVPTHEARPLEPTSVYGISKRDQEELALVLGRTYGVPTIALRFLNTYGSRQALSNPYTGVCAIMTMRILLGKRPTLFEDGGQLRDPTHVADVADAVVAATEAPEPAWYLPFNIGAGKPVSVADMARTLARALERDIEPDITREFRRGDIRHCFADVSRAASLLGWRARIDFEDGARELANWARYEALTDHTEAANAELRRLGLIA